MERHWEYVEVICTAILTVGKKAHSIEHLHLTGDPSLKPKSELDDKKRTVIWDSVPSSWAFQEIFLTCDVLWKLDDQICISHLQSRKRRAMLTQITLKSALWPAWVQKRRQEVSGNFSFPIDVPSNWSPSNWVWRTRLCNTLTHWRKSPQKFKGPSVQSSFARAKQGVAQAEDTIEFNQKLWRRRNGKDRLMEMDWETWRRAHTKGQSI